MKLTISEAKRRVLLPELARILGVPGKIPECDGETVPCFWTDRHAHADRNPSFNFYDGLTRYKCFACSAEGDAPDLVAEWCGFSKKEGVRRFLEIAGDDSERVLSPSPISSGGAPAAAEKASPRDPWNDSPEKEAKRKTWPALRRGTAAEIATVARLRALDVETLRAADRLGWLRFCELAGRSAWVLVSDCGRMAQARRMDGGEWERAGNKFKAWSLPGSCAAVPIGLKTLVDSVRVVGIASGGPDALALLQMVFAEGVEGDCAVLGILGESVKLAAPLVERCAGKRVRVFAHNDEAGRRAAAAWAEQLGDAVTALDAFDFAVFGCKDLNDYAKIPPEGRDYQVLPR